MRVCPESTICTLMCMFCSRTIIVKMYIYQFCFLFSLNPRLLGEVVCLISLCPLLDKDNKALCRYFDTNIHSKKWTTFPNEMSTFNDHLIC